jgi:hypothetical protein
MKGWQEKMAKEFFSPLKLRIEEEMMKFVEKQADEFEAYTKSCDRLMTAMQIIHQRGGKERENLIKTMDEFWADWTLLTIDINKELEKVFIH